MVLLWAGVLGLSACGDDGGSSADSVPPADTLMQDTVVDGGPADLGGDVAQADSRPPDGATLDGPTLDSMPPDSVVPDGALVDLPLADGAMAGDGPAVDTVAPGDQAAPDAGGQAAPQISSPAAGAQVFGKIDVSGSAEPAAALVLRLLLGSSELARAELQVPATGSFSATLFYSGASHNDALTLEASQTTSQGTSPAASVALTHYAPHSISGSVEQLSGDAVGTAVYLRLYLSNDPAQLLTPVGEFTIIATDSVLLPATPFALEVPDGSYVLRAYRDVGGPNGGGPDTLPTLDTDPQSPGVNVAVSGAPVSGVQLQLNERQNSADAYSGFDARTTVQQDVPYPPNSDSGGTVQVGKGLCGGYYLQLRASLQGNVANLSAPSVRLPSGDTVQLLDDGGCSEAVLDNSSMGFDWNAGDGELSYGLRNPGPAQAGDYTLFYRQTVDDFIHIETDNVAQVVRLSRMRELLTPATSSINTNLSPTITWSAVAGAAHYEVDLSQLGGAYDNGADPGRSVAAPSYTPATPLNDVACYRLALMAYDADPAGDVDAEASGNELYFCTDVNGTQTVVVSGSIDDRSGAAAPIQLRLTSDNNGARVASARLPSGSTSYSVALLAGDGATSGSLVAFVDADGTGSDNTPVNRALVRELGELDMQSSTTLPQLVFNPVVQLTSPAPWSTPSSLSPSISWNDYATTAPSAKPSGAFVYGAYVEEMEAGFPGTLFVLPSSATSLDLANLPPATAQMDAIPAVSCIMDGGTFSRDSSGAPQCAGGSMSSGSVTTLKAGTYYRVGVVVVECDFASYSPTSSDQTLHDCVINAVETNKLYALSSAPAILTP